jgi:predicted porin
MRRHNSSAAPWAGMALAGPGLQRYSLRTNQKHLQGRRMTSKHCKALLAGLSLAAACGAASAQNVNLYGLLDVSIGRTQAPGAKATNGVDSGKMTTSHWGVRGTEDLGDGMKAVFTLESFMRADTGSAGRFDADTFWARNAFVGLEGRLGTVTVGRNTTSLFVQTLVFNALGDSFGLSPSIRHYFTSGTVTGDTGWNDSIRYAMPRTGGFSASLMTAVAEGNGKRNAGANVSYFSGALGAGFAWQDVKKGATVQDTVTWQLAGSYDLKSVKLFAQYGNVENDNTGRDYDILGLGATVPVGPLGLVRVQYGQLKPDLGAKRTTLSMGYSYNLSKSTELYGVYMNDKLSGVGTGNNYSAGVRHRF